MVKEKHKSGNSIGKDCGKVFKGNSNKYMLCNYCNTGIVNKV